MWLTLLKYLRILEVQKFIVCYAHTFNIVQIPVDQAHTINTAVTVLQ